MGLFKRSIKKYFRALQGTKAVKFSHAEKFVLTPVKIIIDPVLYIIIGLCKVFFGVGEIILGCGKAIIFHQPNKIYFGLEDIELGAQCIMMEGIINPIKSLLVAPYNGIIAFNHSEYRKMQFKTSEKNSCTIIYCTSNSNLLASWGEKYNSKFFSVAEELQSGKGKSFNVTRI